MKDIIPPTEHKSFGKVNRAKYTPPTIDVPFPLLEDSPDILLDADGTFIIIFIYKKENRAKNIYIYILFIIVF